MAWFQKAQLIVHELPATEGKANAVNNVGEVVGWSSTNRGPWRATLWDSVAGTTTDLGSFGGDRGGSWALGINDLGQVVGYSLTHRADARAFLWKSGTMVDLNSLAGTGGSLFLASGINNAGHIVGRMNASSSRDWFLLTPKP